MKARLALIVFLVLAAACSKEPASSGGSTAESDCPKDLLAARGKSCSPEGKSCTGGQTTFTHLVMCSSGKWTEMNAPPPPPPPPASAK